MIRSMVILAVAFLLLSWASFAATPFQFNVRDYSIRPWIDWLEPIPAVADFDANGTLDIFCSISQDTAIYIFSNEGEGQFGAPRIYGLGGDIAYQALPADVNADGFTDIVVLCPNNRGANTKIRTYVNDGSGELSSATTSVLENVAPDRHQQFAATGDIDNDGDFDLVLRQYGLTVYSVTNDGSGAFSVAASIPVLGADPAGHCTSIELVDLNQDDNLDLTLGVNVSAFPYPSSVDVLFGLGNGTFGEGFTDTLLHYTPKRLAIADFDNNRSLDIAFSNWGLPEYVTILPMSDGNVDTSPLNISSPPGGSNAWGISTIDLNEDGWTDFVTTTSGTPVMNFFLNQHDGTFRFVSGIHHQSGLAAHLIAADVNGDGLTDLVAGNSSEIIVMLKVSCAGDLDADGNIDISDVSLLISFLYLSGTPPTEMTRANVDGQDLVDISDLSALIGYLYLGSVLPTCP